MFKEVIRSRKLLYLFLLAVGLKLFSLNAVWVERYYTHGIYPLVSTFLRMLFGWLPLSIGDLAYLSAGIWVAVKIAKVIGLLKRRQLKEHLSWRLFARYLKLLLVVYLAFTFLWGLNYYRQGITKQLGLAVNGYSGADLIALTAILRQRLNAAAEKTDSLERLQYNQNNVLFSRGIAAYKSSVARFPFLAYNAPSVKPSLFTPVGHLFGFTGYYNPFSGEAQLKTSVPVFLKPFIVTHEMAHQLGYAKENEANFVAFLTCKESANINFIYSAYFEMFRDAVFECRRILEKERTDTFTKNLTARVLRDNDDLQRYLLSERNGIEPFMSGAYDKYLKLNNQPNGKATYDEVIAYLIAYMKKFGKESI